MVVDVLWYHLSFLKHRVFFRGTNFATEIKNYEQMKNDQVTKSGAQLDMQEVEQFAGLVVHEISAGMGGIMVQVGHELGLYKAMMDGKHYTARILAQKTGCYERYLQEWLNSQAAGGYIDYDTNSKTYFLSLEKAMVLAQEESPAFLAPGFSVVQSMWADFEKLREAFKTGEGIPWREHHHSLFFGTEAFYRSGYKAHLVNQWIPKLEGIQEKLERGGTVADIGCGHGASTLIMAERFPNSTFHGFDSHMESVMVGRERAHESGLENVFFFEREATKVSGDYDLICFMDAFHDFGDPLKAGKIAADLLHEEGSLLLVEPKAGDSVEDNLNPIGRMFYSASTALCVPHSNSEEGKCCLGAQAGPKRITSILEEAGFSKVRIVETTAVNHIIEAKL